MAVDICFRLPGNPKWEFRIRTAKQGEREANMRTRTKHWRLRSPFTWFAFVFAVTSCTPDDASKFINDLGTTFGDLVTPCKNCSTKPTVTLWIEQPNGQLVSPEQGGIFEYPDADVGVFVEAIAEDPNDVQSVCLYVTETTQCPVSNAVINQVVQTNSCQTASGNPQAPTRLWLPLFRQFRVGNSGAPCTDRFDVCATGQNFSPGPPKQTNTYALQSP